MSPEADETTTPPPGAAPSVGDTESSGSAFLRSRAAAAPTSAKPAPTPPPDEPPFPLADAGEYFIGLWNNYPCYGCPYCSYSTIEGSGAVELHILDKIEQGVSNHVDALEIKKGE